MIDLFAALQQRWKDANMLALVTQLKAPGYINTIYPLLREEPQERAKLPYAILVGIGEAPFMRTNKSKYENQSFEVSHYSFDENDSDILQKAGEAAFEYAPLPLAVGTMLNCFGGPLRVEKVDQFSVITQEFRCQVGKSVVRQPGP